MAQLPGKVYAMDSAEISIGDIRVIDRSGIDLEAKTINQTVYRGIIDGIIEAVYITASEENCIHI